MPNIFSLVFYPQGLVKTVCRARNSPRAVVRLSLIKCHSAVNPLTPVPPQGDAALLSDRHTLGIAGAKVQLLFLNESININTFTDGVNNGTGLLTLSERVEKCHKILVKMLRTLGDLGECSCRKIINDDKSMV